MTKETLLSTSDNPFNPFTEFKEWYRYDTDNKYYTPGLLDRYALTSYELSEADYEVAISKAIDEIVLLNATGVEGVNYIKVTKN